MVDLEPLGLAHGFLHPTWDLVRRKGCPLIPKVRRTAAPPGARGRGVTLSSNVWQGDKSTHGFCQPQEARNARNLKWRGRSSLVRH